VRWLAFTANEATADALRTSRALAGGHAAVPDGMDVSFSGSRCRHSPSLAKQLIAGP
jgi:hypothetical protein